MLNVTLDTTPNVPNQAQKGDVNDQSEQTSSDNFSDAYKMYITDADTEQSFENEAQISIETSDDSELLLSSVTLLDKTSQQVDTVSDDVKQIQVITEQNKDSILNNKTHTNSESKTIDSSGSLSKIQAELNVKNVGSLLPDGSGLNSDDIEGTPDTLLEQINSSNKVTTSLTKPSDESVNIVKSQLENGSEDTAKYDNSLKKLDPLKSLSGQNKPANEVSPEAKVSSDVLQDPNHELEQKNNALKENNALLSTDKQFNKSQLASQLKQVFETAQSEKMVATNTTASANENINKDEIQADVSLNKDDLKTIKNLLFQTTDENKSINSKKLDSEQAKMVNNQEINTSKKVSSYNSTFVDSETLKDNKVSQENLKLGIKENQLKDDLLNLKSDNASLKINTHTGTEQLIKMPMQTKQSVDEFSGYINELESHTEFEKVEQLRVANQLHSSNVTEQRVKADPSLFQAINITRNDAAKALQEKVSIMLNLNNKEAEIRLDPPELGSMQIRIKSDAEQAQVSFIVQNQQAKELLEESMSKLKDMLAEQGIQLGESSIEGQSQEQAENSNENHHFAQYNEKDSIDEEREDIPSAKNSNGDSGIDYYA